MKKFLLILVSTIAIISCSESKVSTLEIPITSSSEDAIDLI